MSEPSKQLKTPSLHEAPLPSALAELFRKALREGVFSGASLLVASPEEILWEGVFGHVHRGGIEVSARTHFDLASLTKPLVTASLCMWAVSSGLFGMDDLLGRFFPPTALSPEKTTISVRQLLNHCSGLPAYEPYYRELISLPSPRRHERLLSKIFETPLLSAPGTECRYSDLGFFLLGTILETALEKPLDRLASELVFQPLGIRELCFRPFEAPCDPAEAPRFPEETRSFAATEHCTWRNRLLQGEVHDENAYSLGGVAPHAGLFGTARGVLQWLSFLWGIYRGSIEEKAWHREVVSGFWEKQRMVPASTWALGFDTPSLGRSSAGDCFSPRSIGHLGFTGTSFWMDLEQDILVILLTNRVHPRRENDGIRLFRPALHNLVMEVCHGLSRS